MERLRERVTELEETLRAIRSGEVDALLVSTAEGEQVFTLQGAEHPYRILVEKIDEGAATLSDDGTVLYSNKSFAGLFNVALEKFIGAPLQDFVSGEHVEFLKTMLASAKVASTRGEIRLQRGNQHPRTIRLTLSPNNELGINTLCAVATELTEIVDTNEALRVTEASLRQLSGRLLQLQDEERRRIARDLHDITGQKIVVLTMALDRLARMPDVRESSARETIKESRDVLDKISEEIRTLSYVLHPPLLDECGLPSAVRWYAEGFQKRSGIKVDVHIDTELRRLTPDAETALFRVVQESLTNVHRYSGSSNAQIRITEVDREVRLEVIDHGKGGKASRAKASDTLNGGARLGVGIPGMRERLRQLNGRLDVDFGTQGTRVLAVVPAITAEAQENSGSEPADTGMAAQTDPETRRRILIADDHEIMRRGLRGLLESHQEWAVCGEAVEGHEVVLMAKELRPDLVIMDINMPGLSGIDAFAQIREESPGMKILFFTVHDSEQMAREIAEAGGHGYVAKSRAGRDLVDAVQTVLAGKNFFPTFAAAAGRR